MIYVYTHTHTSEAETLPERRHSPPAGRAEPLLHARGARPPAKSVYIHMHIYIYIYIYTRMHIYIYTYNTRLVSNSGQPSLWPA